MMVQGSTFDSFLSFVGMRVNSWDRMGKVLRIAITDKGCYAAAQHLWTP